MLLTFCFQYVIVEVFLPVKVLVDTSRVWLVTTDGLCVFLKGLIEKDRNIHNILHFRIDLEIRQVLKGTFSQTLVQFAEGDRIGS